MIDAARARQRVTNSFDIDNNVELIKGMILDSASLGRTSVSAGYYPKEIAKELYRRLMGWRGAQLTMDTTPYQGKHLIKVTWGEQADLYKTTMNAVDSFINRVVGKAVEDAIGHRELTTVCTFPHATSPDEDLFTARLMEMGYSVDQSLRVHSDVSYRIAW